MHSSSVFLPAYEDLPVRTARWVVSPFGRQWLGDTSGEELTLRTMQSADGYRALQCDGVLRARRDLREELFLDAYSWMEGVAADRLPTSGDALLWFWAQTTRSQLRSMEAPHARGDVLLTVRMPRSEVLLSHFDEWHSCLNNQPVILPEPGEDDDTWWTRAEPIIDWFYKARDASGRHPAHVRAQIEDTWHGIFDQSHWKSREYIQAVAHQIRAEDVIGAVKVRRGRKHADAGSAKDSRIK